MRMSFHSFSLFLGLLVLLLVPLALGAELSGTIYTESLIRAPYTILTINTTPVQQLILENGTYVVYIPEGTYLLHAVASIRGVQYEDELTITIVDEGVYEHDMILFPVVDDGGDVEAEEEYLSLDELTFPDESPIGRIATWWAPWLAVVVLLLVAALAVFASRRQWWARTTASAAPGSTTKELPDDLQGLVAVLKRLGGRATQKELRQHLPLSESKISMMVSDLESRGLVRKIRKGRANIVALR